MLDSLVSVQICCEMSIIFFLQWHSIAIKIVMSYNQGSFSACSSSEIGYSSCLFVGNNYKMVAYVKYGLSQFHYCWPLIFFKGE